MSYLESIVNKSKWRQDLCSLQMLMKFKEISSTANNDIKSKLYLNAQLINEGH